MITLLIIYVVLSYFAVGMLVSYMTGKEGHKAGNLIILAASPLTLPLIIYFARKSYKEGGRKQLKYDL